MILRVKTWREKNCNYLSGLDNIRQRSATRWEDRKQNYRRFMNAINHISFIQMTMQGMQVLIFMSYICVLYCLLCILMLYAVCLLFHIKWIMKRVQKRKTLCFQQYWQAPMKRAYVMFSRSFKIQGCVIMTSFCISWSCIEESITEHYNDYNTLFIGDWPDNDLLFLERSKHIACQKIYART